MLQEGAGSDPSREGMLLRDAFSTCFISRLKVTQCAHLAERETRWDLGRFALSWQSCLMLNF